MPRIELFTVGFGRPELLTEQKRLLSKFITDEFGMCLVDNTPAPRHRDMERVCGQIDVGYIRPANCTGMHHDALNLIAKVADDIEAEYWFVLDHDIFPTAPYSLIERIKPAGFWGMGQTHPATRFRYPWPGFAGFSREWLAGRIPDFTGIKGKTYLGDGDTGSGLHVLFTDDDWAALPLHGVHGYEQIRPDDGHGVQSFGFERIDGSWVHLTNASGWLSIPGPGERNRLLLQMVRGL